MTEGKSLAEIFTIDNFRTLLRGGHFDSDLEMIQSLIQRRREVLGAEKLQDLLPGDVFRVDGRVRPKLLSGARIQVTDFVGDDKVKGILLDYCSSKWRVGAVVTLPKTLIGEKIANRETTYP